MRKVILVMLLFGFLTNVSAQKQTREAKKAIEQTDYVARKMKLNDSKKLFLYNVLLEKFESTSRQVKGLDLSKEERKVIYKKTNGIMNEKLKTEFSKDEIKQIKALLKEHNQSNKKK